MAESLTTGLLARGRLLLLALAPAILLALPLLWGALLFVKPAPPSSVRMATGDPKGAYHAHALKFQTELRKHGIQLELVPTAGSVDNLNLLRSPQGGVDIAFVQSGVAQRDDSGELLLLASLFYEPMWVMVRSPQKSTLLTDFRGKRLAIGAPGSATRVIATRLLEYSGLDARNVTLVEATAADSIAQLKAGRIDGALVFLGLASPLLEEALQDPQIHLMNLAHAQAYARRMPDLMRLVLPRGALDIRRDLPAEDLAMLASTGDLVARADFHPALMYLMLRVAKDVFAGPDLFARANDFPSLPKSAAFDVAEEAERFFQQGTPFLYRFLPFWLANLVTRFVVLLVPIVAIIVPLTNWAPRIFLMIARRPQRRAYARLRRIEADAMREPPAVPGAALLRQLDELEAQVRQQGSARELLPSHFVLLQHITDLRRAINEREAGRQGADREAGGARVRD